MLATVSKYPTHLTKTIKIRETFQHCIIYRLAFSWSQDVVSESFLIYHSVSFTKQDEILFANSILPCLNQNKALEPPYANSEVFSILLSSIIPLPSSPSFIFYDTIQFRTYFRTALVVQWLRICLLVQGQRFDSWSRKIPHAMRPHPRVHAPQQE